MTELQEARAKWLDAETRCLKLQGENFRLAHENYELKMKLMSSECVATSMMGLAEFYAKALVTV